MSLLLDSAKLDDAARAAELAFVNGVTTNPVLMRHETRDPLAHLGLLLKTFEQVDVYYQPAGVTDSLLDEAERAHAQAPGRVVLKLPATGAGVRAAAALVHRGVRVSLTAAQSPHVLLVAHSIGAESVIPYVDRAVRDLRTDSHLVAAMARVRRTGSPRIVAASVKSQGQLLQAFEDGSDAVSTPLTVLEDLVRHPATEEADQEFARVFEEVRR